MFCNKCGKEIFEGVMCEECFKEVNSEQKTPISDMLLNEKALELLEKSVKIEEEKKQKKERKTAKRKKARKTIGFIFLGLIIVAIMGVAIYTTLTYASAVNFQEEGLYEEAIQNYQGYILGYFTEEKQIECVQQAVDSGDTKKAINCMNRANNTIGYISFGEDVKEDFYNYIVTDIKKTSISLGYEEETYKAILKKCLKNYKYSNAYVQILEDTEMCSSIQKAEYLKNNICTMGLDEDAYKISKELLLCDDILVYFLTGETADNRLYQENKITDFICFWADGIGTGSDKNSLWVTCYEKNGRYHTFRDGSWFEKNMNPDGDNADYYDLQGGTFYHVFKEEKNIEDIAQFTITIDSVDKITLTSCTTGKTLKLNRYYNTMR